jgi:C1A family cysteine protease
MIMLRQVIVLLSLCATGLTWSGFKGIPGQYCAVRPVQQCCESREDDCTVSILGNHKCYCDMFCHREHEEMHGDCCPDFEETCMGKVTTGPCEDHTGRAYPLGERVMLNCKECTCGTNGWTQCEPNSECLIQTDLLDANQGGRYTWQASNYSMFWGKSLGHGIKYRLGTLYPDSTVQNMHGILAPEVDVLPAEFDARENWRGLIGPIRDQGDCGSSWAFSTVTLAEDRLAILSQGKLKMQLSVQQLLSCNQDQQRGCDGGYLDRAWWYIRRLGVVSEACYPYESGRSQVPGSCQINRDAMKGNPNDIRCPQAGERTKVYRITPSYRLASKEEDIQAEILTNGPVQATFRVYEDFYMYKSGVYQTMREVNASPNDERNGYHSVRILGWGVDRSTGMDVKYWLAANSWGTQWGEEGTFKILRGENHCEIEAFVISALGQGAKKRRRRLMRKMKRQRVLKL